MEMARYRTRVCECDVYCIVQTKYWNEITKLRKKNNKNINNLSTCRWTVTQRNRFL